MIYRPTVLKMVPCSYIPKNCSHLNCSLAISCRQDVRYHFGRRILKILRCSNHLDKFLVHYILMEGYHKCKEKYFFSEINFVIFFSSKHLLQYFWHCWNFILACDSTYIICIYDMISDSLENQSNIQTYFNYLFMNELIKINNICNSFIHNCSNMS